MSPVAAASSFFLEQTRPKEESFSISSQWTQVVLIRDYSSSQIQTMRRIFELRSLPRDWDSYGSPPPGDVAVASAVQLVSRISLDSFLAPRVLPVSGGGVQLEWSFGPREVEIEIDDDGSVEYLRTEKGKPIEERRVSLADLPLIRSLLVWVTAHRTEKD